MWCLVSQSPHLRTMSSPEDAFQNPKKLHSPGNPQILTRQACSQTRKALGTEFEHSILLEGAL